QLIELIIRPDCDSNINLNLSTKNKSYQGPLDMCPNDSFVIIRNSQLLCGALDKNLLGSSSKVNIFYILLRDFGEDAAVDAMWRLARMAPVYLSNRGFSIGIGDVRPGVQLLKEKTDLVVNGYDKCNEFISDVKSGKLKAQPGCSDEDTLESLILRELSLIRDHAGQVCLKNLSRRNTPLTMAVCGSKGSFINISQMIACVGQQAISGHRPPDGFEGRSLPHFARGEKTPAAKGFVENSFYTGLTPTEFFFHTMGGREGLVDTAVKTAETGYMQRRLVKCLEDLCAQYDGTVRSSVGDIVEFVFGEDGLDPALMEAKDGSVVDFDHVLEHVKNTTKINEEGHQLDPSDLRALVDSVIEKAIPQDQGHFRSQLEDYVYKVLDRGAKYWNYAKTCEEHESTRAKKPCNKCKRTSIVRNALLNEKSLTHSQATSFVELCGLKLRKAITEPGTAVGAIAATSIGEPSTQMTLKTFHFAGCGQYEYHPGSTQNKGDHQCSEADLHSYHQCSHH
ncbi:hypothetical protein PENTCL1PPCAC_26619, partial [Pristionchus entomophagus]